MKLNLYDHKELNFVELNITGTEDSYNRCDSESRYLDSVVFNLFTECFEKANKLYDYYQPTKYNSKYIIRLRNIYLEHLIELEHLKYLGEFQKFISGKVLGKEFLLALVKFDRNWIDHWNQYHKELLALSKEILALIDFCIDEDRILWVIGY